MANHNVDESTTAATETNPERLGAYPVDCPALRKLADEIRDTAQDVACSCGSRGFDAKAWGTGPTAEAVFYLGQGIQAAIDAYDLATSTPEQRAARAAQLSEQFRARAGFGGIGTKLRADLNATVADCRARCGPVDDPYYGTGTPIALRPELAALRAALDALAPEDRARIDVLPPHDPNGEIPF